MQDFTLFPDTIDRFGPQHHVASNRRGMFVTTDVGGSPVRWTPLGDTSSIGPFCGVRAAGPTNNPTFYGQAGNCRGYSAIDRLYRYRGAAPGGTWQEVPRPRNVSGFGVFSVVTRNPNRLMASHIAVGAAVSRDVRMVQSSDGGAAWSVNNALDNLMTGGGLYKMSARRGGADLFYFTSSKMINQPTAFTTHNVRDILPESVTGFFQM